MAYPFDEGNNNATTYTGFIDGLLAAPSLQGINIEFGFENRFDTSKSLPFVCFYFTGGSGIPEQRYGNLDPTLFTWKLGDQLVFECWAAATNQDQVAIRLAVANQDAVAQLIGNVLQALEYQRTNGLRYGRGGKEELQVRWSDVEQTSYGRGALVMTPIDIMFTQSPPVLAPVDSVPITPEIVEEV